MAKSVGVGVDWTRGGPELLLALDRGAGEPLGVQLQAWREAIRAGRLERGERLPSSRGLAVELAVSRGLVVDTYAQLEAEGFVVSRPGSGTVVATGAADARPRRRGHAAGAPTATGRRLRVRRARPRAVPDARLDVGARRGGPPAAHRRPR